MCDVANAPRLRAAVHAVVEWYNLSRKDEFDAEALKTLSLGAMEVTAALCAAFAETGVHHLQLPKLHRLCHVAESVRAYGRFNDLTTELSESKHRDFKKMFRWYVHLSDKHFLHVPIA